MLPQLALFLISPPRFLFFVMITSFSPLGSRTIARTIVVFAKTSVGKRRKQFDKLNLGVNCILVILGTSLFENTHTLKCIFMASNKNSHRIKKKEAFFELFSSPSHQGRVFHCAT